MDMTEKQLSSEYKFRGRIMTARVDEVLLPNGKTAPREVCEHVGGVGVLPIDKDGNVYGSATPTEGTNYELEPANGWFEGSDGYFYYPTAIAAQNETPVLFKEVTQSGAPDGCSLRLTILADGIQSEPADAVTQAWGVTVTNGTISK